MHNHFDTDLMEVNTPYPRPACCSKGQTIITLNLILTLFVALNVIKIKVHCLQCNKGDNKEN